MLNLIVLFFNYHTSYWFLDKLPFVLIRYWFCPTAWQCPVEYFQNFKMPLINSLISKSKSIVMNNKYSKWPELDALKWNINSVFTSQFLKNIGVDFEVQHSL